jgi:hypothetical protein
VSDQITGGDSEAPAEIVTRIVASARRALPTASKRRALADSELATAFPRAPRLRSIETFAVIAACGCPMLRRLIEEGLIGGSVAATLCRLSPAAQEEVLRLGLPAARAVAREIRRTLRDEQARKIAEEGYR